MLALILLLLLLFLSRVLLTALRSTTRHPSSCNTRQNTRSNRSLPALVASLLQLFVLLHHLARTLGKHTQLTQRQQYALPCYIASDDRLLQSIPSLLLSFTLPSRRFVSLLPAALRHEQHCANPSRRAAMRVIIWSIADLLHTIQLIQSLSLSRSLARHCHATMVSFKPFESLGGGSCDAMF